jgi:uncharacterized surface protein with fasciclin (FAS1) repeats
MNDSSTSAVRALAGTPAGKGRARVVQPNVLASNGVIHVVNRVLIPR